MIIFMGLKSLLPHWMNRFEELPGFWIINQVEHLINQRINQTPPTNRIDLLQLMLDASTSNTVQVSSLFLLLIFKSTNSFEGSYRSITNVQTITL